MGFSVIFYGLSIFGISCGDVFCYVECGFELCLLMDDYELLVEVEILIKWFESIEIW